MPVDLDPDQRAYLIREANRRDRTDALEAVAPDWPPASQHYSENNDPLDRVTPPKVQYNWLVLGKMLFPVDPLPEPTGLSFYKEPPLVGGEVASVGWNALARAVSYVEGTE